MTKILSSDCSIAMQSSSTLKTDIEDSNVVKTSINSFVSESPSKLSGEIYDKIRNSFDAITPLLNNREQVASNLADAIEKVNKLFEDYLNGDSEIDNSNIDDVKSSLDAAYTALCSFTSWFKFLNNDYRACKNTYETILKQYNRLLELDQIDAQAVAILSEAANDILLFSNNISSYETDRVAVQV